MSEESDVLREFIETKADGKALSIVNLDGGGAIELIDVAIEDVVKNCASLNHVRKTKRVVTFKLTIEPVTDDRNIVRVGYDVDAKLAKRIPISEAAEYKVAVDGTNGPFIRSKVHHEQGKLFDMNERKRG